MPFKPQERQYRTFMEFRAEKTDEKELILKGNPVVFDTKTVLYKWGDTEYYEMIDRHALDECDFSDFIFNRNHGNNDGTVYARSRNGSIKHSITEKGLEVEIHLDGTDERHKQLYNDIVSGRVDKMSFAFNSDYAAEYDRETHISKVTKIRKIYDVSAVDFPAYDQAEIQAARDRFNGEIEKAKKAQELTLRKKQVIIHSYF